MEFAERLRLLRKKAHLKQTDVARMVGIPIGTYNSYETKNAMPPVDTLMKLATAFNVDMNEITGFLPNPYIKAKKLAEEADIPFTDTGKNIQITFMHVSKNGILKPSTLDIDYQEFTNLILSFDKVFNDIYVYELRNRNMKDYISTCVLKKKFDVEIMNPVKIY